MKANNSATQHQVYGFIVTIVFLALFVTLEAQATPQQADLTHTRGDANQALTQLNQAKIRGLQASTLTQIKIAGEQTDNGGRNRSGGRDSGEEDVVVVIDGYQSADQGRIGGREDALVDPGQTDNGGRNRSGGRDSGEEDVVVVIDGYQSVGGDRVRGRDATLITPEQTDNGGRNRSGGRDSGEEDVVVVIDGYQSADQGRIGGREDALVDPGQTDNGGRNRSGGRDSGEEDVVVVIDGYQSVGEGDVQGSEAAMEKGLAQELPSQATLHGNYPNPFNPSTTIRFELTEAQPVRLAVYNALGQQVQVLADSQFSAGQHEVRFDAMNLASGLYLARLETPGGVSVQRMMLAK